MLPPFSKTVEAIVFSDSALPAALSSEQVQLIVSRLEEITSADKRPCEHHFFGKDSVCAQTNSFLVAQGCPSRALVESCFVAAGEHSELGEMLQWFASAVVALFVDGVKSGVSFPQAWEESMRRYPTLAAHTFELQGFSALFSFLLFQLAAVEGTMSRRGASGDVTDVQEVMRRSSRKNVQRGIKRERVFRQREVTQERASGRFMATASHNVGTAAPKDTAVAAAATTTTIAGMCQRTANPTVLPHRPLAKTLIMRNVQPLWNPEEATDSSKALKPMVPSPSLELPASNKGKVRFLDSMPSPMQVPRQTADSGTLAPDPGETSLFHYSKCKDGTLVQAGVFTPPLAIQSKTITNNTENVNKDVDSNNGACTSLRLSNLQGVISPTAEESASERRRRKVPADRPGPFRMEDLQQQMRTEELRRKYGVKKIINYAERDLEEARDQMERMREILDAEYTPMSDTK
ncbi:hypothetical protein TraAM80_02666 [Trypanosoma rangeli]|uniref:Uncharacterized protein n=1 Tax=Trypanosoma rangeli TaxID=5698 RepID=A0A422NT39_TRYRA|nr:uncharacterized protein TraAM80_02666 [Trypanosoma rangeli]RNF08640.1 hypothetical protein TraAM80_02666 [Trypanosoma rangeli]|eukprot:RNF08640.1 hypothetical protein TraAM80_02666 [Trypanosoma rangeli]